MQKITALRSFITQLDLVAAEQIESVADDLVVVPAMRENSITGQLIAAEIRYSAMFYIERYPYKKRPANLFFAQLSSWLIQNDTDRTDPVEFPVIVDVNDTETADLEFGILFRENITITEDLGGDIVIDGVSYRLL